MVSRSSRRTFYLVFLIKKVSSHIMCLCQFLLPAFATFFLNKKVEHFLPYAFKTGKGTRMTVVIYMKVMLTPHIVCGRASPDLRKETKKKLGREASISLKSN